MTAIDSGIDALAPVDGLAVSLAEGVLSVTIDRPDSLNSLTLPVFEGLADAMEQAANDPRVKVVRLGGAGRGFCSGAGMSADDVAGAGPGDELILAANRVVRAITAAATTGGRGGAGRGGRRRRLHRLGLRPRIGFGQSVFHARVHEDRPDARRRRLGADRRCDRPDRCDADGVAGRATARRRRPGGRIDQRGLPGRRLRRGGGQGGGRVAVRPGGGVRQDQAGHQRGHAHRVGANPAARTGRASRSC